MYIRRKVFSVIEDESGKERYFSTTEFVNEETYLQKEFGAIQKAVKPIKNFGRKLSRDFKTGLVEAKLAAGKDLTNKEVGRLAAKTRVRAQRYDNGKMGSFTKKVIDMQGGRTALSDSAKGLSQRYKSGHGVTNLGGGLIL